MFSDLKNYEKCFEVIIFLKAPIMYYVFIPLIVYYVN